MVKPSREELDAVEDSISAALNAAIETPGDAPLLIKLVEQLQQLPVVRDASALQSPEVQAGVMAAGRTHTHYVRQLDAWAADQAELPKISAA